MTGQASAAVGHGCCPDMRRRIRPGRDSGRRIAGRSSRPDPSTIAVRRYLAASVLVDSRITESCDTREPGIAYGAGVEQWPGEAAARRRAEYLKNILASAPKHGSECQAVNGNPLLRVSGELKPSAGQAYQAAVTG